MKNKKTNLILVASVLLLIGLSGAFVYLFNAVRNKNKHISSITTALGQKIKERENIGVFDKKTKDLTEINDYVHNLIVNRTRIDKFVEYLESLGVDNNVGLTVKGVDPQNKEKNKILISLNIIGDFSSVMKVISILENSKYNLIINSAYLNKESFQNGQEFIMVDGKESVAPASRGVQWSADLSFDVLSN